MIGGENFMAMVKDYLHNAFKHGIESGKLQYGVGQELASAENCGSFGDFKF